MKPAGASARIFFVSVLRPMRCCSSAKLAGAPSFQTTISPSTMLPSGQSRASATNSGKRSVSSSSPRDQIHTCPPWRTTCARMPSYFHSICQSDGGPMRGFELVDRDVERMSEEERKRLAGRQHAELVRVGIRPRRRDQAGIGLGIGPRLLVGVAHHALGDQLGIERRMLGQRALHQQLADADPEAAADQLGQQETAGRVEFVPVTGDRLGLPLRRRIAQRQQAVLDPLRQAAIGQARRRRQHQRDRLGQVADRLVALLEQPVVDAGALAGERAQQAGRNDLARLAAGQKIDRPRRIGGVGQGQVGAQRAHFVGGRGARIEGAEQAREAPHQPSPDPASAPPSAASISAWSAAGVSRSGTWTSVTGTGERCTTAEATVPGAPRPLPITIMSQP